MNKLNFIKADKPDCSNATDSGKITVTVREFITTTLAEKIATALWNSCMVRRCLGVLGEYAQTTDCRTQLIHVRHSVLDV